MAAQVGGADWEHAEWLSPMPTPVPLPAGAGLLLLTVGGLVNCAAMRADFNRRVVFAGRIARMRSPDFDFAGSR